MKKMFIISQNKNNDMENYSPEEVKKLIKMLNSINAKVKKVKAAEPTKLEKQIRYLEQRLKFFNPTKEMLGYIINQAEHGAVELDPVLLEKLKSEFAKKGF
jgi:tRNA C32,U32 (ribose-2'-O)-methylase TrmJ